MISSTAIINRVNVVEPPNGNESLYRTNETAHGIATPCGTQQNASAALFSFLVSAQGMKRLHVDRGALRMMVRCFF